MIKNIHKKPLQCKLFHKMNWKEDKDKNNKLWDNKRENLIKCKRKNKEKEKSKERDKDNDKKKDKDKNNVEFNKSWLKAINLDQVQHQL